MIYYYSATGNTRAAAEYLGSRLDDKVVNLLDGEAANVAEEDPLGLMFPIYCWGVPPVVTAFARSLLASVPEERYLWVVCTCGDEAGTAMKGFDNLVRKLRGRGADTLFSVIMPNTYVMLPGFDVDSAGVESRKLREAPARLDMIAGAVGSRRSGIYDVCQGSVPALRSAIFPVFEKWGVNTRWWHVADACIGCGRCAAICPARNVTMRDGHPLWGRNCFSCCACYHCCPVQAVSYASFTRGKGQYLCPANPFGSKSGKT